MDAITTTIELTEAERLDRLRLIRSDNVGPRTFRSLLDHCGSAQAAIAQLPELARRGGRRDLRICSQDEAHAELAASHKLGIRLLAPDETRLPVAAGDNQTTRRRCSACAVPLMP